MKKLIIILIAIVAIGCTPNVNEDNSFEKYIEWCSEEITIGERRFTSRYGHIVDITFGDTTITDTFSMISYAPSPSHVLTLDNLIDELNQTLKDSSMVLLSIETGMVKYKKQRCIPTIEDYIEWKKDPKEYEYINK
jgi:hypothetical protein